MQKMGKKNIDHYFLFLVIFSKILKQKYLIPTKSCFLDGKKPNIARLVDINFLVFEKHAKNGKKKYLSSLFSIFCDFL